MKEEIPKCYSCILRLQGNPMVEVGEIGKEELIQEVWNDEWRTTGVRQKKLYQCPECKEVKIY